MGKVGSTTSNTHLHLVLRLEKECSYTLTPVCLFGMNWNKHAFSSLKMLLCWHLCIIFHCVWQMCYIALWNQLCVLVWNSPCQIWSIYKCSVVTGKILYRIQLPDCYFLLIILVTLKVSLFICRSFQSLVTNCRVSAFVKKSYLIGEVGKFINMTFLPSLWDKCSDLYE
jgi:hypothetical protein